ncbi:MAG TPA: hypothetical protein ACFCUD_13910 [Cyclobacteriaceae bacterium]
MKKLFALAYITFFLTNSYAQKFISTHTVGDETKSYAKILVVVKAKDALRRVELEDDIVKRLEKKDISAVPSYLRLSDKVLKAKEKDEKALEMFVSKLRENDFQGILVTSLVDAEKSVKYNPAQYSTSTVPVRYGRFGRYYGTARVGVYEPASVEKHQNFILESLLYDLRGSTRENSLHWIGKIKVTDPSSFDKTSNKYAKKVVKKLAKEAIE